MNESMTKYHGSWGSYKDMAVGWSDDRWSDSPTIVEDMAAEDEILFASYGGSGYDGNATVIFQRGGELFEVSASHCSCNGLEDQWSPAKITWGALEMRLKDMGSYYGFLHDHEESAQQAFRDLVATHVEVLS